MAEHTSISVPRSLKQRMDEERATGQSYSGFIRQLMDEAGYSEDGSE
jgi:Arc/MetJ-type ribon-helix-helix transcriptional regulator